MQQKTTKKNIWGHRAAQIIFDHHFRPLGIIGNKGSGAREGITKPQKIPGTFPYFMKYKKKYKTHVRPNTTQYRYGRTMYRAKLSKASERPSGYVFELRSSEQKRDGPDN